MLSIMSPVLFLKRPTAWLEAISQYRGTVSFAPNFAYELCLRRVKPSQIDALDLSQLARRRLRRRTDSRRHAARVRRAFAAAGFRASSFVPSYGLAEHSLAVAFSRDGLQGGCVDADRLVRESRGGAGGRRLARRSGSSAAAVRFPATRSGSSTRTDSALPERHVGTIVARGPSVMAGYFEDPGATRRGPARRLAAHRRPRLHRRRRAVRLRPHEGSDHPAGPQVPSARSRIGDCRRRRHSRRRASWSSASTASDEADEVVAVLEARASMHVRRHRWTTCGAAFAKPPGSSSIVWSSRRPGTIPRTTSGKVRRAETRARFQAGTLLTGGRERRTR